ncbi:protein TRM32 [Tanacetum coccineum]
MAKVLWTEDDEQFGKSHPGCISGIFHALDYQYWHSNVKKILPHRKHEGLSKNAKRNRRYKRLSDDQDSFEVLNLLDTKTSHILVDQSNRKITPSHKRSIKARIKALVSEDNDKGRDHDFVPSPKLLRTYSIHHMESNEWVHPIIFFPENDTETPVTSKRHSDVTLPEINESRDVLEVFEVDKELFVNVLQDRLEEASDTKPKLTKSGSFPTAYKSDSRNFMPMKLKDKLNESYTVSKADKKLDSSYTNEGMPLRRISSLNESADRFAQLSDFCFSKEATQLPSRSLKLTNRSENPLSAQEPSFLKRTRSLPRIDNPNQESRDTYLLKRSFSQNDRNPVSLHSSTDKCAELNSTQDSELLKEEIDEGVKFLENEHPNDVGNHQISNEVIHQSPVLVPEYCPPDEEDHISDDFEENLEEIKTLNGKKIIGSSMRRYQKDDDFSYVKQILERSGFIKHGFEKTWYSTNQPLDPFVFQEIESQYFHDPELFAEEMNELSHRLLIFDLVDDVLLTMYERSLTYYPKALSSFCHVSLAPTGASVLNEVWKRVSRLLNLKPDMSESLDCIVSRDLRSDDGWMNLQLDSECVGLDLEDLIFDELLEEILSE